MCDAKHKTDFCWYTLNTLWFLPKCISVSIWLLNTCSLLFPEHFISFKRRRKSYGSNEGQNYFFCKIGASKGVTYSFILLECSCAGFKNHLSVCLQKCRAQRNMLSCWRNWSDLQIYLPSIGSHFSICSNISSEFVKPPAKISCMQGLWLKFSALCFSNSR